MRKISLGLVAMGVLAACGTTPGGGPALRTADGVAAAGARGTFREAKLGLRTFKLFVPAGLPAGRPAPLVVMLHGCKQDPDDIAAGTRLNALAAREKFYVLYPEQARVANGYKCWNWFLPGNQVRGRGEPEAIAAMVELTRTQLPIDPEAIFCAGISAGGAMASIMGATYPDTFSAIAVASGLEYLAARSVKEARPAMQAGGPPPEEMGREAYRMMQASKARSMPTLIVHGDADPAVAPLNADQLVRQWSTTNDLVGDGEADGDVDAVPDVVLEAQAPNGRRFTHRKYQDRAGQVVLEQVIVAGMGHAWSGGDPAGSFTDPQGPDATGLMWSFFKAHRRPAARRG